MHEPTENATSTIDGTLSQRFAPLVPPDKLGAVVREARVLITESFAGPIAHPRHLREYEEIHPGAADRIIRMAEEQSRHMIEMNRADFEAENRDRRRGMHWGGTIFVLLIVCALVTALVTGDAIISGLFLGTGVLGAVGLFVRGRNGGKGDSKS